MNGARAFFSLLLAVVAGVIGYGVGVAQGVPAQVATGAPPVVYAYPWHFGFGFFGLLFPLLFLFLIFGLLSSAFGGKHRWADRHARLEELHREMHERSGGTGRTGIPT